MRWATLTSERVSPAEYQSDFGVLTIGAGLHPVRINPGQKIEAERSTQG
jgi:hypothetical protein